MDHSLYKVYNTLNDLSIANKMLAKICAFKELGNRILDSEISCFEILNQDYDKILADKFFLQRPSILLHDQEPMMYKDQIDKWKRWRFNTSPFDDRMIILHSERNSNELDEFCAETGAVPCHWFSNGALAIEWFQKTRWNLRLYIKPTRPRLHYKFSCLNRLISHQRAYRPVFAKILMDIVDHSQLRLSCSMIDPVDGVKATDLNIPGKYKRLFNGMDLNDNVLINIDKDDTANGKILNNSYHACSPYFDTVFCHIATETLFMDDTLHLTEKSLRAFVSKRPMLLLGPPHSLSYLRSYGFKTWGDFWDESYDEIRDPWQRMEAVIKIVEKLNSLSLDEMEDMLDAMNHINEHNFRHFFLDFPEKLIRELMDNMHVAVNAAKSRPPNGWMIKRINEVTDEHFKKIISADITDEFSNKELYDDYLMNDKTKIDHNLARVLLLELGFDKESSKEEILARLKIILD